MLCMFLHNALACTVLWNIVVTDNCLLDMAPACPHDFANMTRQYNRTFWARHRRAAVDVDTMAAKGRPNSTVSMGNTTSTTKVPATKPTYAPAPNGTCSGIQVIDYRNHVFLVQRENDTDISVAVYKHEWTIRTNEDNVTTINAKQILRRLKGVDGQSPDTSYEQILGGLRDRGQKAPCKFSDRSFHAFIDYHTLYVTVECLETRLAIVTPPQELIYLDKGFAEPGKHRLASVYAPNDFETVGDALLISYARYRNGNGTQLNLDVVELHAVNYTKGHLNISLTRAINDKEWPLTQIVNIQHDLERNRVAFAVIYGPVGNRKSDFFILPDPKVRRPGDENIQHVTKNFKLRPLKNFTSLAMGRYIYYGVHPVTPHLDSHTFTNLTLRIGPELSPYHWTESFDQFHVCEISNADVNTCVGKLEYKRKVNWLLVFLGAWELLAILVFIVLFIIGIWLQRRRNVKKRGKKGKKNRKGAKDGNNNETKGDTTEATTNNDKTTDASSVATT
ncbi:hypothetical protein AAVH_32511, partial [Aphelenchoides avenae]